MELDEKLRAMEYELSLLKTAHLKLSEGFYLLADRVQRHETVTEYYSQLDRWHKAALAQEILYLKDGQGRKDSEEA
jgi:hypothetical protein